MKKARTRLRPLSAAISGGRATGYTALACGALILASATTTPAHAAVTAGTPRDAVETTNRTVVTIIDGGLNDPEVLASATEGTVYHLDPSRDGVTQITEILSKHQNLDSIHLMSHGGPGYLALGSAILNKSSVGYYEKDLAKWQASLAPGADLLIYGCDAAQGNAGEQFIQSLSAITGADIAASDDTTGNLARGGDWDLEFRVGGITARSVSAPRYSHTMPEANYGDVIVGDGSGGGGGGAGGYVSRTLVKGGDGGDGGGGDDILEGTSGNDVIFGDGSGGGGAGASQSERSCTYSYDYDEYDYRPRRPELECSFEGLDGGEGGLGGSGNDAIYGGAGNDILFGDGFHGQGASGEYGLSGGDGGLGGGGGGGGGGLGEDCIGEGDDYGYRREYGYGYGYEPEEPSLEQCGGNGGDGGIGAGGGGGSDYFYGGNGGIGGGGGGAGGSTSSDPSGGQGGGLGATNGTGTSSDAGGGGGGGGFFGTGGTGAVYEGEAGGTGGDGAEPSNQGNGGNGCPGTFDGEDGDYSGGGGGGAFGNADGGDTGCDDAAPFDQWSGKDGEDGDNRVYRFNDSEGSAYSEVMDQLSSLVEEEGDDYGDGDDVLDGGPGNDHLIGLGGADKFVFQLENGETGGGSSMDTIWDFDADDGDRIVLAAGGMNAGSDAVITAIAGQTSDDGDRVFTYTDGTYSTSVTVRDIGRDLVEEDFDVTSELPSTEEGEEDAGPFGGTGVTWLAILSLGLLGRRRRR